MTLHHQPDPEFVGHLERELQSTIRRQCQFENGRPERMNGGRRLRWTTVFVALAAMGIGSAATFAVTQRLAARTAHLIIARSEAILEFANARKEMFLEELREREGLVADGMLTSQEVDAMRLEHAQVKADASARALDVEESRITGRDPDNSLSAPLFGGRDFVTERLELERAVLAQRAAMVEKLASRPGLFQQEVSAMAMEQEAVRAAVAVVDERIALRQDYIDGTRTARQIELADLQFSVGRQRETAELRVAEVQKHLDRMRTLVEGGLASRSEARQVEIEYRAVVLQRDLAVLEMQILEEKLAGP